MSRRKGAQWERDVANALTKATGVVHRRVLVESQQGNVGDVRCPELSVVYQCKCMAKTDTFQAVREAEAASGGVDYAIAAVKRSAKGKQPEMIAAMPWSDWLEIVGQLVACGVWK